MKYTVYVLYSSTCGKHYTGYTSDLPNRLLSHNHLGKDWTARYRPWALIYSEEFITQQEAMTYEKWLKTGAGRDFVKKIAHWCLDSYPPRRTGVQLPIPLQKLHTGLFCNMKYTVYVLYSSTFAKHYTGYTSDLPNRLLSHNYSDYPYCDKKTHRVVVGMIDMIKESRKLKF